MTLIDRLFWLLLALGFGWLGYHLISWAWRVWG